MIELDVVRQLAKQALTIATPRGTLDLSLWDRSKRLVCNVEHICKLPELSISRQQIDHLCLATATYFSDAGLARHLERENLGVNSGSYVTYGDDLSDICAEVVTAKLTGVAEKAKIEKINQIIIESNIRSTKRVEAMVLSDARNLEDMGVIGILNEFKRYVIDSKSISDALQSWKSKIDYRYWQARLKDGFRFESVRKLAEQRVAAAESFMNQLRIEAEAQDLQELTAHSVQV